MCQEIEPLNDGTPVTPIVALSCTATSALAGAAGIVVGGAFVWSVASTGVVLTAVWHSPIWLATKSNSVAVIDGDERVSGTPVLKQLGAVSPVPANSFVMSIPISMKSGATTWLLPIPSVASEASHGVETVPLYGLAAPPVVARALVVAQVVSLTEAFLQSPPPPLCCRLQSPDTFEWKWPGRESMQPPSPKKGEVGSVDARQVKVLTVLTPPPFENSETTRTSPFVWPLPDQLMLLPEVLKQLAEPCRNQTPMSLVPLFFSFSTPA